MPWMHSRHTLLNPEVAFLSFLPNGLCSSWYIPFCFPIPYRVVRLVFNGQHSVRHRIRRHTGCHLTSVSTAINLVYAEQATVVGNVLQGLVPVVGKRRTGNVIRRPSLA